MTELQPRTTRPPSVEEEASSLDAVRTAFWFAYRHLFPAHSVAAQMPNGGVLISWSIANEPNAHFPYAAPVVLRFDEALLAGMWEAEPAERVRTAHRFEPLLRQGLRGYDPFARFPQKRVIHLG
jgi:hypothetical protein